MSWSRTISSTDASSAPPLIFVGCTKPSRSSVVSGESESRGSAATKSAASLIAFTSCPFAVPGCVERPRIVTTTFAALNVSASISPGAAPSSVYANLAPKRSRSRCSAPPATSSSTVKQTRIGACGTLRIPLQVRDRGHDLGDAGLVVGSEQGRAVRGDEIVADLPLSRGSSSGSSTTRGSPGARSGRRRSRGEPGGRRRSRSRPATYRRARSTRSPARTPPLRASRRRSRARRAGRRRARSPPARREAGARGRAASRSTARSRPRPSTGCRCGRSAGSARGRRPRARPRAASRTRL